MDEKTAVNDPAVTQELTDEIIDHLDVHFCGLLKDMIQERRVRPIDLAAAISGGFQFFASSVIQALTTTPTDPRLRDCWLRSAEASWDGAIEAHSDAEEGAERLH